MVEIGKSHMAPEIYSEVFQKNEEYGELVKITAAKRQRREGEFSNSATIKFKFSSFAEINVLYVIICFHMCWQKDGCFENTTVCICANVCKNAWNIV